MKWVAFSGWTPVNGRRLARERVDDALQALELGLVEAGADLAGVAQLAVLGGEADHERADLAGAPAVAAHPAADHDVGVADVLDLHPALVERRPGTYGQSRRLATRPSRPWALEASSSAGAVADVVGGRLPGRAGQLELGEPRAALVVGQLQQRVPVEPQQVEDHVDDGLGLRRAAAPCPPRSGACAAAGAGSSGARCSSSATTSPSRIASWVPSARPSARSSG